VLTHVIAAWEQRNAELMPSLHDLGRAISPAMRGQWAQAVAAGPKGAPEEVLLRLEMAAEVPTPAEHLSARRMLQLQLLTRRNDPAPAQTWGQDVAKLLGTHWAADAGRRLQAILKSLLRK
jgi:hypothetical protein